MSEVLSTRTIVDRMLANATGLHEDPAYLRALADVVMYDDLHEKNRAASVTINKSTAALLHDCLYVAWEKWDGNLDAEQDIAMLRAAHALGYQSDAELAKFIKERLAEEEEIN